MHKYSARVTGLEQKPEPRQDNNEVPQELVLNLLAQGYPLEELLEFFPMFTLDQLMLLLDDEVIH